MPHRINFQRHGCKTKDRREKGTFFVAQRRKKGLFKKNELYYNLSREKTFTSFCNFFFFHGRITEKKVALTYEQGEDVRDGQISQVDVSLVSHESVPHYD